MHCIHDLSNIFLLFAYFQGQVLVDAVYEILPEIPNMTVYLQGKTDEQKPPPFLSFQHIMSSMTSGPVDSTLRKKVNLFMPAVFIYTSGTTGELITVMPT